MPVPQRRAPAAAPPPPTGGGSVNFGDPGIYTGGFTLPEGDYALEFMVQHEKEFVPREGQASRNQPRRLGVLIIAHPLDGRDPMEQFMSMGSKAHESYVPSADGKGVEPVAGGSGAGLNNKTNWMMFLNSLYDSGLPQGIFTNDFGTIDGVWVHTGQVPEPEDRKGFQSQTGEAAQEQRQSGPRLIPVVTEILDGGKPWEGGGGFDFTPAPKAAAKAPAARPGTRTVAAPAARPAAAAPRAAAPRAAAPVAEVVEEAGDDEVLLAAQSAITEVLTASPDGVAKLKLRLDTFKHIPDAAMKQAVTDTFFSGDDAALNRVLGALGYTLKGQNVVPAS